MSIFSVDIEIGDPAGLEFVTVNAVVDTAASYTTLPESLLHRLGIRPRARRRFVLADSRVVHYPPGANHRALGRGRVHRAGSLCAG